MIAWFLATALAQEDPSRSQEVLAVDVSETTIYVFPITSCDRFRAEQPVVPTSTGRIPEKIVITLQNRSPTTCLYKGVVLQGWLTGVYKSSLQLPEGSGMFLPPGGELSFRIKPFDPGAPRGAIQLQLPPKSGAIVLIGVPPAPTTEQAP
jgi:hypothetical protein